MIRKILVAVDGSEPSKKALEFACDLSDKFDAELAAVHVVEQVPGQQTQVLGTSHVTVTPDHAAIEKAGRSVADAARRLVEEHGGELASTDVVSGSPAKAILEAARRNGVDTIVMGSRGLSDLSGLLMGSVSHKVAHLAECTCIVVR